jgi:hypothetical protein
MVKSQELEKSLVELEENLRSLIFLVFDFIFPFSLKL